MKKKLLILFVLFLFFQINQLRSQLRPYLQPIEGFDDGAGIGGETDSVVDNYGQPICCENYNEFKFDLYFNNLSVLLALQANMAAAQQAAVNTWLIEQEGVFLNEMNKQLGTNHNSFSTAQRDYFKHYEKNYRNIENASYSIASSHRNKAINLKKEQEPYSLELHALDQWNFYKDWCGPHQSSTCNVLSNAQIRGTNLGSASNTKLEQLWNSSLLDFSEKEYESALNDSWASGIEKIINDESLINDIVNKHMIYYGQQGFEEKVFLMIAYLTINNVRPPNINPLSYLIPDLWSNNSILEMGKNNAPVPSLEELVFFENYIQNRYSACQSSRPRGPGGVYLGPDYCIPQRNELESLKEQIISERIESASYFYIDAESTPRISSIRDELKCFDKAKSALLTIYVEQPVKGSRDITAALGHTFIGIEQGEVIRNIGFYPDNGGVANLLSDQDGELHDNSGSKYHVSISLDITSTQLTSIINFIENYPPRYSLNNYNCSDFGLSVAKLGGLSLPETKGTYGVLFNGRNPADLGEDLRELTLPTNVSKDTSGGSSPNRKGNCN